MDDNSTDGSKEIIKKLGDPMTRLVTRDPSDRGLAASVFQGIVESATEYFMVIDCDFQHPVSTLGRMYEEMEGGADLCIGVREDRLALGLRRWAASWTFNTVADLYLLCHHKRMSRDVMSGLFAGRTDVFVPVLENNWDKIEMSGWKVLLDLLKFGPRDIKIASVKYKFRKRIAGMSHLHPSVVVSTFNQCGTLGKICARVYRTLKRC
jgi:dolichol-phosphate mannosyltransferase